MITEQDKFEEIIYDLNELSCETDCPVRVARLAIKEILEPVIGKSEESCDIYFAIGEILKDVETHGDINSPRLIRIHYEIGGLAIDTFNRINPDPSDFHHNGFGRAVIQRVFGDNYSFMDDGEIFESHLFVTDDILDVAS